MEIESLQPPSILREKYKDLFFGAVTSGRMPSEVKARMAAASKKRSLYFSGTSDGGRCSILKEPSLVRLNYELTWMKPKIDLRELAKLRESGLSLREIERITGVGRSRIMRKLLKMQFGE